MDLAKVLFDRPRTLERDEIGWIRKCKYHVHDTGEHCVRNGEAPKRERVEERERNDDGLDDINNFSDSD